MNYLNTLGLLNLAKLYFLLSAVAYKIEKILSLQELSVMIYFLLTPAFFHLDLSSGNVV